MKAAGSPQTFVEKILGAPEGTIVFRKPDIVLTHDNTASIEETFTQMGGGKLFDPERLLVVLDHNAPPTNAKLANDYRKIRDFVKAQGISRFYDVGKGICHQLMAGHARPGMLIAGSDSHTCTAGAFNTLAVGIDRTEAAGLFKRGETWFRVPRSMKITLTGTLPPGVYAKDLALWIIGKIGVAGANYLSIEFHGDGVKTLSVSERMTLANMASEMGAKNAVFPADDILARFLGDGDEAGGLGRSGRRIRRGAGDRPGRPVPGCGRPPQRREYPGRDRNRRDPDRRGGHRHLHQRPLGRSPRRGGTPRREDGGGGRTIARHPGFAGHLSAGRSRRVL